MTTHTFAATLGATTTSRPRCHYGRVDLIRLRDGAQLVVRPIRPTDAALLTEGFDRLSADSRWFRFLGAKKELSAAELRYLSDVDHVDHEALIAIDAADGRAVGVARYLRLADDPRTADVAVVVVDSWHRRGVATALFTRLNDRARKAGIQRYAVTVSADNVASLGLLRRFGFDPATVTASYGLLEASIPLIGRADDHRDQWISTVSDWHV